MLEIDIRCALFKTGAVHQHRHHAQLIIGKIGEQGMGRLEISGRGALERSWRAVKASVLTGQKVGWRSRS